MFCFGLQRFCLPLLQHLLQKLLQQLRQQLLQQLLQQLRKNYSTNDSENHPQKRLPKLLQKLPPTLLQQLLQKLPPTIAPTMPPPPCIFLRPKGAAVLTLSVIEKLSKRATLQPKYREGSLIFQFWCGFDGSMLRLGEPKAWGA